jgi:hypothetical protein
MWEKLKCVASYSTQFKSLSAKTDHYKIFMNSECTEKENIHRKLSIKQRVRFLKT